MRKKSFLSLKGFYFFRCNTKMFLRCPALLPFSTSLYWMSSENIHDSHDCQENFSSERIILAWGAYFPSSETTTCRSVCVSVSRNSSNCYLSLAGAFPIVVHPPPLFLTSLLPSPVPHTHRGERVLLSDPDLLPLARNKALVQIPVLLPATPVFLLWETLSCALHKKPISLCTSDLSLCMLSAYTCLSK